MEEQWIGPVRPLFNLEEEPPKNKRVERLVAGTNSNGMMIDVSRQGLEINGYYVAFNDGDTRYSILREPVVIPWDELTKMKDRIFKAKKHVAEMDRIEEKVDKKYLKTLPVIIINGGKYYIDPEKRERRSVDRPQEVWKF